MKAKSLIALALIFVLLFSACSQAQDLLEEASNAANNAINSAVADPDDTEIDKHNAYIDLYNELVGRFTDAIVDYSEEFGWDPEVFIEDGFSGFSMYGTDAVKFLDAALTFADKEPAAAEADAAVKDLATLLKPYAEAMTAAKTYYSDKNYVDDDFAKSQEYHDVIVGGFDAMWEKAVVFLNAVDVLLEGQDEEQLESYKSSDQMIHYYSLLSLMEAEAMCDYLATNEISMENFSELNLDEFRPLYDKFAEAYNGYKELVGDDSNAGKDEGIMSLTTFTMTVSDIKQSAAELVEKAKNGGTFSDTEMSMGASVSGSPEELFDLTGELLDDYNNWIV